MSWDINDSLSQELGTIPSKYLHLFRLNLFIYITASVIASLNGSRRYVALIMTTLVFHQYIYYQCVKSLPGGGTNTANYSREGVTNFNIESYKFECNNLAYTGGWFQLDI